MAAKSNRSYKPTRDFTIEKIKNGLVNGLIKCKPKRVPKVPDHLPKLPALFGAFGRCGSGKTYAYINLIKEYQKYGCINRLFIISPTKDSNAAFDVLKFDPKDVYTASKNAEASLEDIKRKVKLMVVEYEREKQYKKAYEKACKNIPLTIDEREILKQEHFREPVPIPWPQPG